MILLILAGAAYAGLVWYPERSASDLMVPSSREFADARESFRDVVAAYPNDGDAGALAEAEGVLDASDDARARIGLAQLGLEEREPTTLPVISDRPPLRIASDLYERMANFYAEALMVIVDLEAVSRYLTELSPILDDLQGLRTALREAPPEALPQRAAALRPIAQQLRADLRALTPPDELAALHSSLLAIGRGIRSSIDGIEGLGDVESPILASLVDDIEEQLDLFEETALTGPREARTAGLDEGIRRVERIGERIVSDLMRLRDEGVEDLTIPTP